MLLDLDELVLTCQDPRSKEYIREAVLCYKAGAYRSAVVASWIAVAFDIVDKIRELAASGDKMAEVEVTRFEKIQRDNDIRGALAFEKELPELALKKFEFISHMEYEDLCRLVMDRNRCAHPSHVVDSEIFNPSAELARLHISNVVTSVLSRPAASGKSALDRVMVDLASRYFPSKPAKIIEFLSQGPLGRPRAALYRNFCVVMLKILFSGAHQEISGTRVIAVLPAIKQMHPHLWDSEFLPVFNAQVHAAQTDAGLRELVVLICFGADLGLWDGLGQAQQDKLASFVENSPSELLDDFEIILDGKEAYLPLKTAAEARLSLTYFEELKGVSWVVSVPEQVLNRLLTICSRSRNFADANEVGRYIKSVLPECEGVENCLRKFVSIIKSNDQVLNSNELPSLVRSFLNLISFEKVKEEFDLVGVDLNQYMAA
ncbi:MAG: hypothetical protein E2581_09090 [Pseudomonas sp.]|uniref:hypothetical protein n=2 Tax=Pseudomonas TaxID=286 RepID=UPI001D90977D|nr:hypothetical protein [Pseudomonas sp.]MPS98641.1 hypothetical protein [Pseudomonas sp.]